MTNAEIGDLIRGVTSAIDNRENLHLLYQGLHRVLTPHLLGKTNKGRYVIHGFQYGGATSKGSMESPEQGAWRFFYLDEVRNMVILTGDFAPPYPQNLQKSIHEKYTPPAFITEVLALRS